MSLFYHLTSKLKNAIKSNKKFILLPKSSFCLLFLKLMFLEGFISHVVSINSNKFLKVHLKYSSNGTPSFTEIKLLTTPSKNFFLSYSELNKISKGVGVLFISTNQGLFTQEICLKRKLGGVALCYIL